MCLFPLLDISYLKVLILNLKLKLKLKFLEWSACKILLKYYERLYKWGVYSIN